MEERILDKIRKVLALTTSPVEGEAQAAAAMLQKLLAKHNLQMADLEQRGAAKAGISTKNLDLGKAAFKWKHNLAFGMADFYFCHAVFQTRTGFTFVGRPDNVETLEALYNWLVEQIKVIARETRRQQATHIDPLRWQLHFGLGAVNRLLERLKEQRDAESAEVTALVLSHRAEISDWLEEHHGFRVDGRRTKSMQEWYDRRTEQNRKHAEAREAMMATDPEAWYEMHPEERPEARAKAEEEARKRNEAWEKKYRARAQREPKVDWEKEMQAGIARRAGCEAADSINLQPFLKRG